MSADLVDHLQRVAYEIRPLKVHAADDERDLAAEVPETSLPTPLDSMMRRQLHKDVTEALSLLEPREQEIIRLRFGIDRERRHTLEEIGRMFNLSREGVRQAERRALGQMLAKRETLIEHLGRGSAAGSCKDNPRPSRTRRRRRSSRSVDTVG